MSGKIIIPKNIELPTRTAWWVCGELKTRRRMAKNRLNDLIKTRDKLKDDLNQFGGQRTPERTKCAELFVDALRAIDAVRNEISWLADQLEDAFDHANEPKFWEDEEKVEQLLGEPPAKSEPIDELIAAASEVSAQPGPVGGETPPPAAPGTPAPLGKSASGVSLGGLPTMITIAPGTTVEVVENKTWKVVKTGCFHSLKPADDKQGAMYVIGVDGWAHHFMADKHTLRAVAIPLDARVLVLHLATNELKAEGTLEHETDELYRVRIGAKLKDFPKDTYRIEPVPVDAAPAKLEKGTTVRVLNKSTGELEGTGRLDNWNEQHNFALVTFDGRHQKRFAFDSFVVEAAPAPEVSEKKKPGKKPMKT